MQFQAVLANAQHPEYGVATIPFPIPKDEYDHVMSLLEPMELGDPLQRDCKVEEISDTVPILKRLEKVAINVDELDYLAKRLSRFEPEQMAKFQAMAVKLGSFDMTDLINLSFCSAEATVIQDFRDLEEIGKHHIMDCNGGMLPPEPEDGQYRLAALKLILNKAGTVTPYGVVYDNGMKLEQLYDGQHFPEYRYEPSSMTVKMTIPQSDGPEATSYLYLPLSEKQLDHVLQRTGIADGADVCLWFVESQFPEEVDAALEFGHEDVRELNRMCQAVSLLTESEQAKLAAVVTMAKPERPGQLRQLAENLDQFEYVPNISTPEEFGQYMIWKSGLYDYDPTLDDVYDFAKYAQQRMEHENGQFNHRGYVAYYGSLSLEELMMDDPTERQQEGWSFQMGGME